VPTGHGSGASKYGMTLAFDNMVKYAGKVGNLAFGASVGAGEAARSGDGAKAAVAASWSHAPFSVVAGWERVNDTLPAGGGTRPATRAWHLGAMLQRGPWRLQAGGRDYRHDGGAAPAIHARLLWAGANYQLTPALTATAAFYRQDVRDAVPNAGADPDATMLVTRLRYALSPRTDLYAVVARATTGAGAHVSLARDEVGYASGQRSLVLGLQQRF
jgi:predicted porin